MRKEHKDEKKITLEFTITLDSSEFSLLYGGFEERLFGLCVVSFLAVYKHHCRFLTCIGSFVKADEEGSYGQVAYMLGSAKLR